MANNKDFTIKNAVEVSKDTKLEKGTITNNDIDLSTGNYFTHTPSGASTYTISNAGEVQTAQIEVTGGADTVDASFATTLYVGNGTGQDIVNGLDLAGDGGLVWMKSRDLGNYHLLMDSEGTGTDGALVLPLQSGESATTTSLTSFNSDGFTLGSNGTINNNTYNHVAWSWKQEPGFFDIVTWTGNGQNGNSIPHNLGIAPGMVIVKRLTGSEDWPVQHRSISSTTGILYLNRDDGAVTSSYIFQQHADSSNLYVGNHPASNDSGVPYVAYLFGHDGTGNGDIYCGSFIGNGSTSGPTVNFGFRPQFVFMKNSNAAGNAWIMLDKFRGVGDGGTGVSDDYELRANSTNSESADSIMSFTDTGFTINSSASRYNGNGATMIFMAIREGAALDLTWPTNIQWAGGAAPSAPATGETDVYTITTDDGGTTFAGYKSGDNFS